MIGIRQIARNLREAYVKQVNLLGPDKGEKSFRSGVSATHKKVGGDLSIRALAEGIMGESWHERYRHGCYHLQMGLRESSAAVDVSAFSNITGQLLVDRIRENYDNPQFIGDSLFEIAPVTGGNLGLHREPWLSEPRNGPSILQPQQEYPETDFIEQYIDLPALEKRGEKCSISMEMIFADKTKQAMKQAEGIGRRVRYDREVRQLKVVAGIVNNWVYMGTAYNTYSTNNGLYVNDIGSNTILDYKGVASIELLFSNMTDFVTGLAVLVDPAGMQILHVPYKTPELKIALHAARTRAGGYGTAAGNTQQEIDEVPLINDVDYPLMKSAILWHILTDSTASGGQGYTAANGKEILFMGHFKKAFVYREAMPFTTAQAPPGNPAEFNQDIAVQVKAMEWGVAGVQDPRQVCRSYLALA